MLNRVSQPDPYELPNINNLLDKLSETKYLSTLDLHQSYFQVGLHPDSQPYTAFTYNGRRYQFLRMLQGHKTSSAQFSRLMSLANFALAEKDLVEFKKFNIFKCIIFFV